MVYITLHRKERSVAATMLHYNITEQRSTVLVCYRHHHHHCHRHHHRHHHHHHTKTMAATIVLLTEFRICYTYITSQTIASEFEVRTALRLRAPYYISNIIVWGGYDIVFVPTFSFRSIVSVSSDHSIVASRPSVFSSRIRPKIVLLARRLCTLGRLRRLVCIYRRNIVYYYIAGQRPKVLFKALRRVLHSNNILYSIIYTIIYIYVYVCSHFLRTIDFRDVIVCYIILYYVLHGLLDGEISHKLFAVEYRCSAALYHVYMDVIYNDSRVRCVYRTHILFMNKTSMWKVFGHRRFYNYVMGTKWYVRMSGYKLFIIKVSAGRLRPHNIV